MNYLIAAIIGVGSSFIASVVFLVFLTRVRPRIDIAGRIAFSSNKILFGDEQEGKAVYEIKVINRIRRPAINLKAELQIVTQRYTKGGPVQYWKDVHLIKDSVFKIQKYDRTDKEGLYAFRFRTFENLHSLWEDDENSHMRLRVAAQDSLSGFSEVFVMEYYLKEHALVEGRFAAGDSFEIS